MNGRPTALVIGASGGIGEALAHELAEKGLDVDMLVNNAGFMPGPLMAQYYATKA